ncbi:alpha/beta fold hydrolase [Frigidibacter sp. ROC022]|uniref:alpha/beta fold hydrolase n=1 Tax=Frigidibacter sp. ROC022 TaxID=2971796 RepID=UPI00215A9A97|nr:alpha/beta hydrolase [Frigidibacter sp. ROC022]MCR8722803.1 alpha/beta hydrolase [Frigidibacter sp. ROC022]
MSLKYFDAADGTRLAYRDEGAGLPLLCLAGLTRDGRDFDYLVPHLPPLRLIRPDYRGRGSSAHADPATYTPPVEAKDALALLDHLGIDKAAVLGTSRGGLIAMGLAGFAKDRLLGVCLNDVGPVIEKGGLDKIKAYIGRAPKFRSQAEMAAAMPGLFPEFVGVPASRWAEEVSHHTVQTGTGLGLTYDPRLREAVLAAFEGPQPDLWPLFDAFEGLPLALLRGANSDLLGRETAAEMRRRRPDMIFAEVPDRGHIPFLDEPESLAAITAWLELMP